MEENNNIIISAPGRPEPKILYASKYYRLIFSNGFGADSFNMPLYEAVIYGNKPTPLLSILRLDTQGRLWYDYCRRGFAYEGRVNCYGKPFLYENKGVAFLTIIEYFLK